ncbi:histidine phosphatase family protein [Candidatus Micrarchaeota archaeon]|nr:histidine phosphatase family protein [Candidatus Micrarchaeota archaeon]
MGIIYIIRHAQSIANKKRIYNSNLNKDEGLSDLGKKQLKALVKLFKSKRTMRISVIYSSPFPRAIRTAQAIAKATGSKMEITESFRELDCGGWDGKTEKEIMEKFPEAWSGWHNDPENNPIPGGESLFEVQARVMPEFLKIAKRHNDGQIIIVTHYCVLNVILCSLISSLGNFRCFDSGNATIAKLKMNNVPRLEGYCRAEEL